MMVGVDMMIGGGWYPVALAADLEAGSSTSARLFGAEIVVWRAESGGVQVWEDRCPHRGMRLSFGFVRGDRIACLYHGWQFDPQGRCRFIPAHPQLAVPDTIRVARRPSLEACGMIWTRAASENAAKPDDTEAESPTLPDPAPLPVRSLYVDRPAADLAAAMLAGGLPGLRAALRLDPWPLFDLDLEVGRIVAGLQPIGPTTSALHVTCEARADRKAIAVWCEALRRAFETAARHAVAA